MCIYDSYESVSPFLNVFAELTVIQQNMSFVNEGYDSLGEKLKSREAELKSSVREFKEATKETDTMTTWLKDMKKSAASWTKSDGQKDSVKTQLEQQKVQKRCCPRVVLYWFWTWPVSFSLLL